MTPHADCADATLRAVRHFAKDRKMQEAVCEQNSPKWLEVMKELDLPATETVRLRLLEVLSGGQAWAPPDGGESLEDKRAADEIDRVVLDAYRHNRYSFWISITMSVALFAVGLAFLGSRLPFRRPAATIRRRRSR